MADNPGLTKSAEWQTWSAIGHQLAEAIEVQGNEFGEEFLERQLAAYDILPDRTLLDLVPADAVTTGMRAPDLRKAKEFIKAVICEDKKMREEVGAITQGSVDAIATAIIAAMGGAAALSIAGGIIFDVAALVAVKGLKPFCAS